MIRIRLQKIYIFFCSIPLLFISYHTTAVSGFPGEYPAAAWIRGPELGPEPDLRHAELQGPALRLLLFMEVGLDSFV